jgi:hypothetical protein
MSRTSISQEEQARRRTIATVSSHGAHPALKISTFRSELMIKPPIEHSLHPVPGYKVKSHSEPFRVARGIFTKGGLGSTNDAPIEFMSHKNGAKEGTDGLSARMEAHPFTLGTRRFDSNDERST